MKMFVAVVSLLFIGLVSGIARAEGPDLSSPRASMATQYALLKAGDVDGLKACFTDRLKERITIDTIKKGQSAMEKVTLAEAAADYTISGETAQVKMKSGRMLTTLVKTKDKWLADTVWFK